MDSDRLLQTSLHRNQIKRPLLEQIAQTREVDPQHLTIVLQSLSRLIRAQDIAFSHQFKTALTYLILNRYDIYPPGAQILEQQEFEETQGPDAFRRQSSIKQHLPINDNDTASVRSGYTTASAAQDDDDDEDEDDEFTPAVPQKMDLLLSQLSLLDPELIQTVISPVAMLPERRFPTSLPAELQETFASAIIAPERANELNSILSTPTAPTSQPNYTTLTNTQLGSKYSFNQLTPLSTLQYHHHNTHMVAQYNSLFPKSKFATRIILCAQPLSLQDCHDTLLACFAPVLVLLALLNIASLAIEDPEEHGDLFYRHPQHPKAAQRGSDYILFESKTHFRIFLQQYLCNHIESIPTSTKHFQPFFFSSQLPPSLYCPHIALQLPPEFRQEQLKYTDKAVQLALKNMYPSLHQPDAEQFSPILSQLTTQPPDTAAIRARLQAAYTAHRRNPTATSGQTYQHPRQSPPLGGANSEFEYFLAEYAEVPPLEEDMGEWEHALIKHYDEYCFHPASTTNPSHITSSQYHPTATGPNGLSGVHKADEIEDVVPKTQFHTAIPHTADYSRPLNRGQYGSTFVDIENMPPNQFIRLYINIARQNNYRVQSASSSNNKITTKASPITLSEYVGWQYHQMQDQYILFTYLRCFLTHANFQFMQKLLNDTPEARSKYLVCVTDVSSIAGSAGNANNTIFLHNDNYNSAVTSLLPGSSQFDFKYVQRPIFKFLVNDVFAHVDITPFLANRTIFPTNLSLLSSSMISTSFIQPRLATHCLTTYFTRIPGQARKQGNSGPPGTLPGFALNGVVHDLCTLAKPTPLPGMNSSVQFSFFELVLFAQSTITSGLIPFLTQKWSESDLEYLTGTSGVVGAGSVGNDKKTLHSLFYSLLAKESTDQFQTTVRSPTKKPLLQSQSSLATPSTPSPHNIPIEADHLVNNLTHLGKSRFDALHEDQVLQQMGKIAQTLRSIYSALVEYQISFGLSNVFNKFSTHRLTKIQYSLFSTLPPLKFQQQVESYLKAMASNQPPFTQPLPMMALNWKPIESTETLITTHFLSKLSGFITPPSYQIYQATPFLLIDVYEHQRVLANRLQFTSQNTMVAQTPMDFITNVVKINKLYDIIEWHWETRFTSWCEGNQSQFAELKKARETWEKDVLVQYAADLVDYEKSPQELIMKLKQHPEWINTPKIPLDQLCFKDYKKVFAGADHATKLSQIEALRGPLRQKSVYFTRDYQNHASSVYQGLTEEMSATMFQDIFTSEALGPNGLNPPNSHQAMMDPDLSHQDFSQLRRFFIFDVMKRMCYSTILSNVYKLDQGFSHVLSLHSPNEKEILGNHGMLSAQGAKGNFGALLDRQKTLDRQASVPAPKNKIAALEFNFEDDLDLDQSFSGGGVEDLFSMGSSLNHPIDSPQEHASSVQNMPTAKNTVPMSPFVNPNPNIGAHGADGDNDGPMLPMSPLKTAESGPGAGFTTPKRPMNGHVDMGNLFNTPCPPPKVSQDDTSSPYSALRKLPSNSPHLNHRQIHSDIESDDDSGDHLNPIRDKLNMSMDDLIPASTALSPRSRFHKQSSKSPQQFPTQLLQPAPKEPEAPAVSQPQPEPEPAAPKATPDEVQQWVRSKLNPVPPQSQSPSNADVASNDENKPDDGSAPQNLAPTSTQPSTTPSSSRPQTLLFDNPLILYTDEQLRKLTALQQSRYRVRRRLLDSLYLSQFGSNKPEFSDSASDSDVVESDTESPIAQKAGHDEPKGQKGKKAQKGNAKGNNKAQADKKTPQAEPANDDNNSNATASASRFGAIGNLAKSLVQRVSRWSSRDPYNFNNVMKQNTIGSIQLENVLTLTADELAELKSTLSSTESQQDAPNDVGNVNNDDQLKILANYVQFDERFISVVPSYYPPSQR